MSKQDEKESAQKAVFRHLWKQERTLYNRMHLNWMVGHIRREIRKEIGDFDPYAEPIVSALPGMHSSYFEDRMIDSIDAEREEQKKKALREQKKALRKQQPKEQGTG